MKCEEDGRMELMPRQYSADILSKERGERMKVKDITDNYKPCPFCGLTDIEIYGSTEIYDPKSGMDVKKVNIGCPDCGVWYDYLFDDEAEAIEQWNTRWDDE